MQYSPGKIPKFLRFIITQHKIDTPFLMITLQFLKLQRDVENSNRNRSSSYLA